MALFEDVVSQVDQRLGLQDKVQSFLSLLLTQILDPKTGGISGLVARLKSAGLGPVADRVLAGRDRSALSAKEVEIALGGKSALQSLATKAGIPEATAAGAAGFLLPRVFSVLAPAGRISDRLPNEVTEYIKTHSQSLTDAEHQAQLGRIIAPAGSGRVAEDVHVRVVHTGKPTETVHESGPAHQVENVHLNPAAPITRTVIAHDEPVRHAEPVRAQEPVARETVRAYETPRRDIVRERHEVAMPAPADESVWLWWVLPAIATAMLFLYSIKSCAPSETMIEPIRYDREELDLAEPEELPVEARNGARNAEVRTNPTQARMPDSAIGTGTAPAPMSREEPVSSQPVAAPIPPAQPVIAPVSPAQPAAAEVLPVPVIPVNPPAAALPAAPGGTVVPPPTPINPPASVVNSRLLVERLADGRVHVSAVVPSEEIKKVLLADVAAAYGDKTVVELTVDPRATAPNWIGKAVDVLKLLGTQPKSTLTFDGARFAIGGTLTEAEKSRLLEAVKALFGSAFEIQ